MSSHDDADKISQSKEKMSREYGSTRYYTVNKVNKVDFAAQPFTAFCSLLWIRHAPVVLLLRSCSFNAGAVRSDISTCELQVRRRCYLQALC